jgi:virginiamycin B lyase
VITEFSIPTATAVPIGITSGPDGALWFVEGGSNALNKVGRITTAGVITEFSIPTANSGASEITTGSDGALWFTEFDASKIGRIGATQAAICRSGS